MKAFLACCALCLLPQHGQAASLHDQFLNPPPDSRIMMRWWWFGPSGTHQELARELRTMKDANIGGVEIQPVYPLRLLANQKYLSPEFLDAVHFASETAHALGMRVDITLGSGWPYGGPHIPVTEAAGKLRIEHSAPTLEDGEKLIAAFPEKSLYFISSRTGQQVKRAGLGAEGFVLNHYDRRAITHHLEFVGNKLLEAFGAHPPYAVFSDSLEVYASDWTDNFLDEFQKRRGYDLKPLLPDLEDSPALRHDWALTLSELAEENYLAPIAAWAHQHHTRFRSQTYGEPPVRLSSGALADLAEGEMGPKWRVFNPARWASSTNHLYGRTITSTETWTWLHSPAFRATPLDMKAEADLHFIQGINQLIGHGWPYSPPDVDSPGWRFYAAAAFNNHNPWFIVMPDIASYLQRVSFLLRQGQPVNDIAIYLPTDDALAACKPGHFSVDRGMEERLGPTLIPQVLDAGFNFDYIDDTAMQKVALPYKVIILPGVERISMPTLRRLKLFIDAGGKVIATRHLPSLAPGYKDRNFSTLILAIVKSLHITVVTDETQLGSILRGTLDPDLKTDSPAIGFTHRKTTEGDIYFLANTSNTTVKTSVQFRATGEPQEWNPFSGAATGVNLSNLEFAPYESKIIVFDSKSLAPPTNKPETVFAELFSKQPWPAHFSGSTTYSKTLEIPAGQSEWWLDFGEGTKIDPPTGNAPGMRALLESPIRECALVYVNSKLAGSVWHPPYRLDITSFTHAGSNEIRLVVANLAINEMASKPLPTYKLLNQRFGERFTPQGFENLQELEAGILEPVTLIRK